MSTPVEENHRKFQLNSFSFIFKEAFSALFWTRPENGETGKRVLKKEKEQFKENRHALEKISSCQQVHQNITLIKSSNSVTYYWFFPICTETLTSFCSNGFESKFRNIFKLFQFANTQSNALSLNQKKQLWLFHKARAQRRRERTIHMTLRLLLY